MLVGKNTVDLSLQTKTMKDVIIESLTKRDNVIKGHE
jgi:hypothetical protein